MSASSLDAISTSFYFWMLIVVLCMSVYTFSPKTIQMKTWNLPGSIFNCNVLYKRGQKQGNDQDYWPLEQLLVYATQQAPLAIFNSPNNSVGSDCELLTPSLWGQYFSLPHAIFCHREEPESLMNTFISYILHMLWVTSLWGCDQDIVAQTDLWRMP